MQILQIMTREQFLMGRKRWADKVRLLNEMEEIAGSITENIILDGGPNDDVICDLCNADISNKVIILVDQSYVYCDGCLHEQLARTMKEFHGN